MIIFARIFEVRNSKFEMMKPFPNVCFGDKKAGVAQLVERQPSKLNVAGSNPVSRSQKTSMP